MDSRVLLRQLLRAPDTYRTLLTPALRPQCRTFAVLSPQPAFARHFSVPTILNPSFWASMIPKPLKERPASSKRREWNPATPYIVLALLVGSQAIQILWLKQERDRDMRRAEAKMGLLKEVIERVQRGEDVDVEKVLGTGDQESEQEWKEVLKDIEEEETLFQDRKQRKAIRQAAEAAEKAREAQAQEEEKVREAHAQVVEDRKAQEVAREGRVKVETVGGAKFY